MTVTKAYKMQNSVYAYDEMGKKKKKKTCTVHMSTGLMHLQLNWMYRFNGDLPFRLQMFQSMFKHVDYAI